MIQACFLGWFCLFLNGFIGLKTEFRPPGNHFAARNGKSRVWLPRRAGRHHLSLNYLSWVVWWDKCGGGKSMWLWFCVCVSCGFLNYSLRFCLVSSIFRFFCWAYFFLGACPALRLWWKVSLCGVVRAQFRRFSNIDYCIFEYDYSSILWLILLSCFPQFNLYSNFGVYDA